MKKPIFITGIERSGSSMIAKIVGDSPEVFVGKTKRMLENERLESLMISRYVLEGCDPMAQDPLPEPSSISIPDWWRGAVLEALERDGFDAERYETWMYKSARLLHTWPLWAKTFPEARWIIVRRRTGSIAQSCSKTNHMRAYVDKSDWLVWVRHQEQLLRDLANSGVQSRIVWPHRMAQGDFTQIQDTFHWLGLRWRSDIEEHMNEILKNSRDDEDYKRTS